MGAGDLAYRNLAVAVAAGLLIGVERGWRHREVIAGGRVAGVRTFALLGGLGGMIGLLAERFPIILAAILLTGAVAMLVIAFGRSIEGPNDVSATSLIAALLTLGIGIAATSGRPALAMALAAVVTLILSLRTELHGFVKRLGEADIIALARFAIIAGAIWPLLPNEPYGPYGAWNPQQLWLVVVFVTGLSFAGYGASRIFGVQKGVLATAVIGGAYSSTAVTALLSHRLHEDDSGSATFTAGIALATSMMFARVLILTAIIAGFALPTVLSLITPALLVGAFTGWFLLRAQKDGANPQAITPGNPVEILPALGFLILVAAMAVAARWAEARFGDAGAVTLIAVIGAFDVDAAIITLGGFGARSIDPALGGLALGGAVLINMFVKMGVVVAYAGWKRGRQAVLSLSASTITLAATGAYLLATVQGQ
jgi:uncharacterized membrane protein (DUF4010 family)